MSLRTRLMLVTLGVICIGGPIAEAADVKMENFANAASLKGFQITGKVTVDPTKTATHDGSGSLKITANSTVMLVLRTKDESGKVEFKVFDDISKPADPKANNIGAYWGVTQRDGRCLAPGIFYASYLSGETSYAITNFCKEAKETPFFAIKYSKCMRQQGWHAWAFDFNPTKGVTISFDGNPLDASRWDWNTTKQIGFNGLIFSGDTSDANGTLWIDDIKVTLGGPMQIAPKPPDAAPAK